MSGRNQCTVISGPDGVPCAVLGAATAADTPAGTTWCGTVADLQALDACGQVLPEDAIFCAELSVRWGCLVACTKEFAAWWRARPPAERPNGFLLEVLS